jgi:hypothetical protein
MGELTIVKYGRRFLSNGQFSVASGTDMRIKGDVDGPRLGDIPICATFAQPCSAGCLMRQNSSIDERTSDS